MQQNQVVGKYKILGTINSGSFGTVFKAQDSQSNIFAIKRLINDKNSGLEQELKALKEIKGQNIVQMIDYFQDPETKSHLIVMEYCDGDLRDYQCEKKPHNIFSEEEALHIFAQIIKGFKCIHEKGFIHRDLKERNILLKNNVIKISDFGLAKQLDQNQMTQSKCWTLPYAAPEILMGKKYNYKVDIWSLGVILYRMLFNVYPFGSNNELDQQQLKSINSCFVGGAFSIAKGKQNKDVNVNISEQMIKLFKKIFVIESEKRIGFKELYDEEVLQKFLKNEENCRIFYNSEGFDVMMLLQSAQLEKITENITQENNTTQEYIREQMLASCTVAHNFASKQVNFQENKLEAYKVYLECLNQYCFLVECWNFFKEDQLFNSLIKQELVFSLLFFLAKSVLYYVRGLKDVLVSKENIFEIKQIDWPTFANSKTYEKLLINVKHDEKKWISQIKDLFEIMQDKEIHSQLKNVEKYIAEEVETYPELDKYFSKQPDSIKLPLRAVLMTCYDLLKSEIDKKINKNDKYSKIELQMCTRMAVRVVICAAWSRLYNIEQSQPQITLLPKISYFNGNGVSAQFEDIHKWILEGDCNQILNETSLIVSKYFPQIKEGKFNFL